MGAWDLNHTPSLRAAALPSDYLDSLDVQGPKDGPILTISKDIFLCKQAKDLIFMGYFPIQLCKKPKGHSGEKNSPYIAKGVVRIDLRAMMGICDLYEG